MLCELDTIMTYFSDFVDSSSGDGVKKIPTTLL